MPAIFALIGLLVIFIPSRCVVGCTVNSLTPDYFNTEFKKDEFAQYFYYDGTVHELDDSGKDIGMIPEETIFCEFPRKNGSLCYKLENGTAVKTHIVAGDSAGKKHSNLIGTSRNFFFFWKYSHDGIYTNSSIPSKYRNNPRSWKSYQDWNDYFENANDKACLDINLLFDQEFKNIIVEERIHDDFDGNFRKSHSGYYELSSEKYPNLKYKSKLYYISKAEYKKLEKIKEEMDKLFQTKYGEYCSPLPVYATLGQMYSWKYPFNIKRM